MLLLYKTSGVQSRYFREREEGAEQTSLTGITVDRIRQYESVLWNPHRKKTLKWAGGGGAIVEGRGAIVEERGNHRAHAN